MFMRSAIVSGSNIYIYIYIFEELIFIIGTASSYFIIFVDSMNPRIRKMFPTWTAMIAVTSQLDGGVMMEYLAQRFNFT